MKYFLLIAGSNYYPEGGSRDWIGTFETKEEAQSQITKTNKFYSPYLIKDRGGYGWYEIVDLREWINE